MTSPIQKVEVQIAEVLQTVSRGSKKIRITFKQDQDGVEGAMHLLKMADLNIVKLVHKKDEMALIRVDHSRTYMMDHALTVTVLLTEAFSQAWFIGRMRRAVEKIEAIH